MSEPSAIGHIVWHDLLTTHVDQARKFYAELLGWSYEVEHATDFVWNPGEADYPLILYGGEAHGGFIAIEPDQQSHWLAFVAVDDVDDAASRSEKLGGTIERAAFEIPGVGRSAVVRDPQGAVICPFVASHDYPAPTGVFLWDELLTTDTDNAPPFFERLFAWSAERSVPGSMNRHSSFCAVDGSPVAGASAMPRGLDILSQWVPYIGVADVDISADKALSLGAQIMVATKAAGTAGRFALLRDPTGAAFGLLQSAP